MSADTLDLIVRGVICLAILVALARFHEASYRTEKRLRDLMGGDGDE